MFWGSQIHSIAHRLKLSPEPLSNLTAKTTLVNILCEYVTEIKRFKISRCEGSLLADQSIFVLVLSPPQPCQGIPLDYSRLMA